jgi:hypothetical protein
MMGLMLCLSDRPGLIGVAALVFLWLVVVSLGGAVLTWLT